MLIAWVSLLAERQWQVITSEKGVYGGFSKGQGCHGVSTEVGGVLGQFISR